jgi:hypothetical protein
VRIDLDRRHDTDGGGGNDRDGDGPPASSGTWNDGGMVDS